MKVAFISNFLSHHQIPFSDAMYELIGHDYCFISTIPMDEERKNMGWEVKNKYPYEVKAYKSDDLLKKARKFVNECDVAIIGSAPDSYINNRLKKGKLTFKYSERLYKQGLSLSKLPRAIISSYLHHGKFQKYPLYMLCASAYTAGDLARFGNYKDRTYKWGYFPAVKQYNIEDLLKSKRGGTIKLLWVGRFLDWKHPEKAIMIANRLANKNIDFSLKMIGSGNQLVNIKNMAEGMGLNDKVEFLGAIPSEKVREYMEETNIYLFTSDFNEGWGAVLNEAMNSACAVVASHAIGAVPYLLEHGKNGMIYVNDNEEDLYNKVLSLVINLELREKLGRNAHFTISNTWNGHVAAERFFELVNSLIHGNLYQFDEGPCSRAEIIKNDWFNGEKYGDN